METSNTTPNGNPAAPNQQKKPLGTSSHRGTELPQITETRPNLEQSSVRAVAAEADLERLQSIKHLESLAESMEEAVAVLNEALSRKHTSAVIRRDEELNRFLVTIKDKESGEIIREIPDEALIKFARNLQELRGILFDERT